MDLNDIRVDVKKVNDGVTVNWKGDIDLVIAQYENKQYTAIWNSLLAKAIMTQDINFESIDELSEEDKKDRVEKNDDTIGKLQLETLARGCLVGWKNISMGGKNIKYSKYNSKIGIKIE